MLPPRHQIGSCNGCACRATPKAIRRHAGSAALPVPDVTAPGTDRQSVGPPHPACAICRRSIAPGPASRSPAACRHRSSPVQHNPGGPPVPPCGHPDGDARDRTGIAVPDTRCQRPPRIGPWLPAQAIAGVGNAYPVAAFMRTGIRQSSAISSRPNCGKRTSRWPG
jgi:hypothetical protein